MPLRRQKKRGYLLLEVTVAGVVLAVGILALFSAMLTTNNQITIASKRGMAASLATQGTSQAMGIGFTVTAADLSNGVVTVAGTDYTVASVVGGTGTETWAGGGNNTGVTVDFKPVNVTVTYSHQGAAQTAVAAARVYDPN